MYDIVSISLIRGRRTNVEDDIISRGTQKLTSKYEGLNLELQVRFVRSAMGRGRFQDWRT